MPRQEHVLTVFVASPSDIVDERARLEDVIRELNIMWSRNLSVRFELVSWETHACPGAGEDAQAVINEQIHDDYDLFVGIMWCRYGTPTGRADSGTVEEFMRAKARYDADPSSVKLMMYFKDKPIPPSSLDPSQLAKINEFREFLSGEGLMYRNFSSVDQFEKLIRLHLTSQVQSWKTQFEQLREPIQTNSTDETTHRTQSETEEDDLGILDLAEIVEGRFEELSNSSNQIAEATEHLGKKLTERTAEIKALPRDVQGNISRKLARRCISKAANDMNNYTARVESELPLFSNALNTGMNAQIRLAAMYVDLDTHELDLEQVKDGLEAIVAARAALTSSQESIKGFRQVTAKLPRMTSELNRAKRGVTSVLDRLMAELTNGQTLLRESEALLRDLLGDDNSS